MGMDAHSRGANALTNGLQDHKVVDRERKFTVKTLCKEEKETNRRDFSFTAEL